MTESVPVQSQSDDSKPGTRALVPVENALGLGWVVSLFGVWGSKLGTK